MVNTFLFITNLGNNQSESVSWLHNNLWVCSPVFEDISVLQFFCSFGICWYSSILLSSFVSNFILLAVRHAWGEEELCRWKSTFLWLLRTWSWWVPGENTKQTQKKQIMLYSSSFFLNWHRQTCCGVVLKWGTWNIDSWSSCLGINCHVDPLWFVFGVYSILQAHTNHMLSYPIKSPVRDS